jgi:hypothetical protein
MYVRAYDPRFPNDDVVFDIDFDTGEITGRSAGLMDYLLEDHPGHVSAPWQQQYDCKDPRHNPADMALFLRCLNPEIEGPLAEYPPPEIEPTPEGAVS